MTTIIVCRLTVRMEGIHYIFQMDGHKFSQCHVHYFTRGCLPGKQTVKELWGQTTRIFADCVSMWLLLKSRDVYFIARCEWDIDVKAQTLVDVSDGYVFYGIISWENAEKQELHRICLKSGI